MYCVKQITSDMYWVGGSDRRLALFENVYPIPQGVSYNAYLVLDEQTVLLDTVDRAVSEVFFENLAHLLDGRKLDYVVVNHMEPDHAATLAELVLRYPDVTIVTNQKAVNMIKNYFTFDATNVRLVKENDTLTTGRHTFAFVMAPMVHWPEVMVSYDTVDKVLYSADAFGTFGAINGNIFADEVNFEAEYLADARRYYTNIVGKYGTQVQALLKKAAKLDIAMVCPLHGPVWRKDIAWFIDKYQKWSTYTPEEDAVVIAYASVYGHTENLANIIASKLADAGVRNVKLYDVSVTHPSYIVSEAFRASHLVFASTTYNAGIFVNMENALHDIVAHNLQNRTIAVVENGSWAATSGGLMRELLGKLKNCTILEDTVSLKSALKAEQMNEVDALVSAIVDSMPKPEPIEHKPSEVVEPNAMFKLSYGLFVLTAKDGKKDNGCIINTAQQVTSQPNRISICVNKNNFTHDMILKTGEFNVNILSQEATFDIFKWYGFQSGRDTEKIQGEKLPRARNGIVYVEGCTNGFISGKVVEARDYGTHTLFVADVTEARVFNNVPSVTYAYYFANIKPKPAARPAEEKKVGWVCKICGYVYEGADLPADFICPLCKHPASDFEKLK
ncbi:MAG: flavin reductase [Clostridia bacterium]|nr:flavin reductase [Clostridia bacterium]